MSLNARLKKLEELTGADSPCPVCTPAREAWEAVHDCLRARGVTLGEPKRKSDAYLTRCPECGAVERQNLDGASRQERALWVRLNDEYDRRRAEEGGETDALRELRWRINEVGAAVGRRLYGEHYDAAIREGYRLLRERYGVTEEWPGLPEEKGE